MTKALIALTLGSLISTAAQATTTENLIQHCGLSDKIYEYIANTTKTKSKSNFGMSSAIGSGRRLVIYPDNSWVLTLEFLHPTSVNQDRTCIIAKGNLETQELATDILKNSEENQPVAPASAPQTPPSSAPHFKYSI